MFICIGTYADETVQIDGVYYQLQSWWSEGYNDANGNWHDLSKENAAVITYNPDTDPSYTSSVVTYQGDIVIPEKVTYNGTEYTVTSVGGYAFAGNRSVTSVQLPSTVKCINSCAFQNCTSMTSIDMPGVEVLKYWAFYNCTLLKDVTLSKDFGYYESEAFNGLSSLESIVVEANNANYCSEDGVLYNADKTIIYLYPQGKQGSFTIPSTIKTINDRAFYYCSGLTELIIPASVSRINNAFNLNNSYYARFCC